MTGTKPSAVFQLDNLSVRFTDRRGSTPSPIQGFNLDIEQDRITCILGRSGCGKSTLLRTLGGFIKPEDSGGVLFRQRYLDAPCPDIVMIFQENNLYPWLSVAGNVRFALRFRRDRPKDINRRVEEMLQSVGLANASSAYPHQLSGGMRQRVAIARALITRPEVMLLDEPFSALDISLKRRMHGLVRKLRADTGTSMVMVTHDVEEAITMGDRVLVLAGNPSTVELDFDTSHPDMRDRYSPAYLELQQKIEKALQQPEDEE